MEKLVRLSKDLGVVGSYQTASIAPRWSFAMNNGSFRPRVPLKRPLQPKPGDKRLHVTSHPRFWSTLYYLSQLAEDRRPGGWERLIRPGEHEKLACMRLLAVKHGAADATLALSIVCDTPYSQSGAVLRQRLSIAQLRGTFLGS